MIPEEYVAGLFDGEGTVAISCTTPADRPGQKWDAMLSISNTDRRVLAAIREEYGGNLRRQKHGVNRPVYLLTWTGNGAMRPILKALQHCRIKARQVSIVKQFLDTLTKGGQPVDSEILRQRRWLRERLHRANRGEP